MEEISFCKENIDAALEILCIHYPDLFIQIVVKEGGINKNSFSFETYKILMGVFENLKK